MLQLPSQYATAVRRYALVWGLLIALVGEYSCANRVPPTGGAPDKDAPKMLHSVPANGALNVPLDASVTLQFDEFTDIQNATTILISPLVGKQPDFKLRGKNVIIDFKEPLLPNTTYTVFFGENLKDVNEGNVLHGFEYTFSTGATRDTLFLKGKVLNAQTNQAANNTLVLLYPETSADTAFLTMQPRYLTRCNENGQFKLSNVAAGNYHIFALNDQNNNYYYDQPNEQIAFLDSLVRVAAPQAPLLPDTTHNDTLSNINTANWSSTPPILMRLFGEGKEKSQIAEKQVREYGRSVILFTKGIDSLHLVAADSLLQDPDYRIELTPDNDTATVWYRNVPEATVLSFALTGAEGFSDTVRFKPSPATKTMQPIKYTSNIRSGRGNASFDLNKPIWFEFSAPLLRFDTARLELTADTLPIQGVRYSFDPQYPRRLHLNYAWRGEVQYELTIPDSTMSDFWGQSNDEIVLKFKAQAQNRYGTLQLRCTDFDPQKSYIFQLRNPKGDKILLQSPLDKAQMQWEQINAGTYSVFVIDDANRNGKWDTGDYAQKRQPETLFSVGNNNDAIEVKSNWDTEVQISLRP